MDSADSLLGADELAGWLRLLETPGVGRTSARRLLAAFGSPQGVFDTGPDGWRGVIGAPQAQALAQPPAGLDRLVRRTQAWLAGSARRALLTPGDPAYPAALLETADPPLLLYAEGRLDRLARPALAVVGSRNPSAQGLANARAFSRALSAAGVVVVSGLALGIDGAAHEGALDTDPATAAGTIAVLGTGLDAVYPRRHLALAERIAEQGLLLSEFCLGTAPVANNFPLRNRIIAGLSLGTLVVEAALQSGSLITARLAAEAGREVFAIPGSIHSPQAKGCHALIKQGAKLVEDTQDILDELKVLATDRAGVTAARLLQGRGRSDGAPSVVASATPEPPDTVQPHRAPERPAPPEAAADDADPVLRALGWSPATLEVLQVRSGLSASELSVRLLELELLGEVARLPGQLFQRQAAG
ncbi:MAG TPA: DNA-processing protein DprA [Burkholderiaceae bacterium]|nr:DNA-processing protein DprA [Burkholderiaceae bacterium]HNG78845.1 DNA-processing protein DprA [Burkholderiaceae bacterium]